MRFHNDWSPAHIRACRDLTPTIRLFEIVPNGPLRPWSPGAHLQVRLAGNERPLTRSYSLIDLGQQDGCYRIAVKRIDNGLGGSRAMWALSPGDAIDISQPHNHFELSLNAPSFTLVAGGVGITPMVAMARFLSTSGRRVHLHYAVRSQAEAAFANELAAWLGERFSLYVQDAGQTMDLAAIASAVSGEGELYVCGPIGMLEAARGAWEASGHNAGRFRYETFAASGHHPNRPFHVNIPRLGLELDVAADETLLGALENAGVAILSDCRRGECGLCAVDIVDHDQAIDHRDVFYSAGKKAENRKLCACVSRPAGGSLTIDTAYRGRRLGDKAA